ncbi:sigma-70 family RNA polymerase sigma factor [Pseudomonas sp. YJ42]|uniref:sigma-70 family RNA polymerase sigma factor n=1 Tax=Pseudomonas sp. YJ42 TaxID=3392115 RepID=UPI00399F57FC
MHPQDASRPKPAWGGFGRERRREAVVIRHYQELVHYLSRLLGDRQVATDLAHDAFVRLLDRKAGSDIEQPRAFLFKTATNLSIDMHRRTRVRRNEPLDSLDHEEWLDERDPEGNAIQAQQLKLLRRALEELPAPCREAFLLRKVEGCSHMEIAERLSLSRDMVEKHIVNAMKHCRVRLLSWTQ